MTRETFTTLLAPLLIALRAEFDLPTWTVYYSALKDVPAGLLGMAIARRLQRPKGEYEPSFPEPGTIRQWAEDERHHLSAAQKFEGCAQCRGTGWDTLLADGVMRVSRCWCWKAHQLKLAQIGAAEPLALPSGEDR